MDLTLFLQQEQLLLCTDFSKLIETGRMTLILKPLLSLSYWIRRLIVIHELFVVNLAYTVNL